MELWTIPFHFALPPEVYRRPSVTFRWGLELKAPLETRNEVPEGIMRTEVSVVNQNSISISTSHMTTLPCVGIFKL